MTLSSALKRASSQCECREVGEALSNINTACQTLAFLNNFEATQNRLMQNQSKSKTQTMIQHVLNIRFSVRKIKQLYAIDQKQ